MPKLTILTLFTQGFSKVIEMPYTPYPLEEYADSMKGTTKLYFSAGRGVYLYNVENPDNLLRELRELCLSIEDR